MWKVSLKGLWAHKRRLFGTVFAVLLGVTFLVGTLVLGDTMRAGFDDLFTEVNAGTDAVVRSATKIGGDQTETRGLIDTSLVEPIRNTDGVRAAIPSVQGFGQIVGKNGNPIGGNGPPTIAASWTDDPKLNPWDVAEGDAPTAEGEVAIDKKVADDEDIGIGDTITVLTPDPTQVKVVGILTIGGEDSLGAVTFVSFTFDQAQALFMPSPDKASEIDVSADGGVSQQQLVENLQPVLPKGVEAITGDDLTKENNEDINNDFLGFFEAFLLVFAGVALLVATFSIYNTFSILIAQRTRESALLRAIGASRRQVLASIAFEALAIGFVASVLGLLAGIGLAVGLRALFDALGFGVPTGAITVKTGTVIAAFLVGMGVTFLATVFPAIRASRVPPLAALRDVAVEKTGVSRVRLALGVALHAHRRCARHRGGRGRRRHRPRRSRRGVHDRRRRRPRTHRGATGRVRPRPADRPLPQDDRPPRARERDAEPAPYRRDRVGVDGGRRRRHVVHGVRGVGEGRDRRHGQQAVHRRPRHRVAELQRGRPQPADDLRHRRAAGGRRSPPRRASAR